MFKFIDRHPFISGFVMGFVGVGVVGRGVKKFLKGKITIIQIDVHDIPKNNLTFGENVESSEEQKPKVEEN